MELRDYQRECINTIEAQPPGAYLVQMATGLGKTVTFANLPRHGERMLILSHREELVEQPRKYFDCPVGVERASQRSDGEEVVSASVQSLVRRLDRFDPQEFGTIICDEAHHAAAGTYRKIFGYFQPQKLVGFTATPNRGDRVRLDDVFQRIIFQRDLRWGIQNGYLCDIHCLRVNIGYDLTAVHTRLGDYAPGELDDAMDGTADAIAEAYRDCAQGATLIFAVSVRHAREIAERIPGAVVVTGETPDRAEIVRAFTAGEIPCIVNCMVFTEGTDIPRVETVIIARPTQSESLYAQMVGRGLRQYPGKEKLVLIDCVGVTGKASLCTAPSLLGLDVSNIPAGKLGELQGDLFDLPLRAASASDCPESWVRNVEIVDLWAKEQQYQTHGVNWFKLPDGSMTCSLLDRKRLTIPCPDALGMVELGGARVSMQDALDRAYGVLLERYADQRYIWDLDQVRRWGSGPATEGAAEAYPKAVPGVRLPGPDEGPGQSDHQQIIRELEAGSMTEQQEQRCVIKWSQQPDVRARWPELAMLFHIPNGGTRDAVEGRHLKQQGVKKGVPDLCLPVPSGRYHGLFIEMKTDTGRATEAQKWWIERLNAAGYFTQVCHGWESAVRMLEWYLSLPEGMP